MANFNKPELTSTYTNFITELKARDNTVSSLFSDGTTHTGTYPVRAIRWNASNGYFERRNAANNAFERLEGASGTHKFVNLETGSITATGATINGNLSSTGQVQAARLNVTGSTEPANGLYLPSTNEICLTTNSSPRLTIESNGEVGIGTVNPNQKLEVVGAARIQNGSNAAFLEIGAGGSGNRFAYIDLVGDGTHTDFGLRLMRQNQGANAQSELVHKGTGNFILEATDAADLIFKTAGTTRMCVRSNGNIGIGNFIDPDANLHFKNTTANPNYIHFQNSEGSQYIRGDNDRLYLDADLFEFRTQAGTRVAGIHDGGFVIGGDPNTSTVKLEVLSNGSTYTDPSNNNVAGGYIYNNNSSSATAHAVLAVRSYSANGGDAFISLDVRGVGGWHVGIDNSDSDKFKIGRSWSTVGDSNALAIDSSLNAVFTGSVTANSFSGSGTNISNVDALKLDGQNASSYVRTDTSQTISGVKTFSTGVMQGKIGVGSTPGGNLNSQRSACIAVGDNDTGIAQNGDGVLELWSNGVRNVQIYNTGTTFYGNVVPSPNANRNLGASDARWNNLYVNDLQMSNKGKQNDVDGTWGDYTIQEGHEDLFLINHRTGKKFKFALVPVA